MKFGIIAGLALSLAACQQQPQNQTATQPVAKQEAPTPPPKPWEPAVFDPASKTAKTNDLALFMSHLKGRLYAAKKGEFETTAEYAKRQADIGAFIPPFNGTDVYLFFANQWETKYDADTKAFRGLYTQACYNGYPIDNEVNCQIGTVKDSESTYQGQNAFGAKAEIKDERGTDYYLLITRKAARAYRDKLFDASLPSACPMPVEQAKTKVGRVAVAYGVRLRKAELVSGTDRIEQATVSSPYSEHFETLGLPVELAYLVCLDTRTDEVLYSRAL